MKLFSVLSVLISLVSISPASAAVACRASNELDRDSFDVVAAALKRCVKGTPQKPFLSCAEGRELQPGRVFQLRDLDEGVGTLTFVYSDQLGAFGQYHRLAVYGLTNESPKRQYVALKAIDLPVGLPLLTAARLLFTTQNFCSWELSK